MCRCRGEILALRNNTPSQVFEPCDDREPFSFGGINASKFGDLDITGDGGLEFFTSRRKITTKVRCLACFGDM